MRMLLPHGRPLPAADLVEVYDWPRGPWVRGCMVMSLDGRVAGPDGLSRSISSDPDRAVLAAVRGLADAYLVGAQTVRAEDYQAVGVKDAYRGARRERGQRDSPVLAVVSASCRLDWERAAFLDSAERPLILTTETARPEDLARAARRCEVLVLGDRRVDPAAALAALAERGLDRVTCEGGPTLLQQLVRLDLLDELALTLSPQLVSGPAPPAPPGAAFAPAAMRLDTLLEADGYLFARYLRAGSR